MTLQKKGWEMSGDIIARVARRFKDIGRLILTETTLNRFRIPLSISRRVLKSVDPVVSRSDNDLTAES